MYDALIKSLIMTKGERLKEDPSNMGEMREGGPR